MGRTAATLDASPEAVWAVLADPRLYGEWVPGSREIRRWDPEWPQVGASFHHTFQIGPFPVKDTTTVLEQDPGRRLVMRARARPTGVAHVAVSLTPAGDGTHVEITEWPVEGPPARLHNPLQDLLINRRNDEALRRLSRLAQRRS